MEIERVLGKSGLLPKDDPAKASTEGAGEPGGVSSDAASALRSAAALHQVSLANPRLRELAAEIGSDVPFLWGLMDRSPLWLLAEQGAVSS